MPNPFLGHSSFNLMNAVNYAIGCVFFFMLATGKSDLNLWPTFSYLDQI